MVQIPPLPKEYNPKSKTETFTVRMPGDLYRHVEKVSDELGYENKRYFITELLQEIFTGIWVHSSQNKTPQNPSVNTAEKDAKIKELLAENQALKNENTGLKQQTDTLLQQLQQLGTVTPVTLRNDTAEKRSDTLSNARFVPDTLRTDTESETPPYRNPVTPETETVTVRNGTPPDELTEIQKKHQEQIEELEAEITRILDEKYPEEAGKLQMTIQEVETLKKELDKRAGQLRFSASENQQLFAQLSRAVSEGQCYRWSVEQMISFVCTEWSKYYRIQFNPTEFQNLIDHFTQQYQNAISSN